MTYTMNRVAMIVAAAALLVVGLAGGYWWARRGSNHDMAMADAPATEAGERNALYWYDPMVPDQHFDKPGKSPFMDMQLVPKYADEVAGGGVSIDPGLRQSVGIRTEEVEVGRLAATVRVPGTLAWDLRREAVVSAVTEGLVSRVQVKAPYTKVARGQPLAALLAPAWSSALAEAQALRQAQSATAQELQSAAQQRLRVLGVPSGLGRDGSVTLSAPHDGVVTEVLVREGQAVMPGTPLFRVNGTATLWLEAAIPQADAARLRPGTPVEAVVSAVPGQTFSGEVETLLPQVDMASRTQQARIVLRNPKGVLAPGMFAEVTMQPEGTAPAPLVPTEALIATGTDSRVIVQDAKGGFQPVRVRTGLSGGGRTEILAGLKGGERVVVSGQFLIDSEASLSGLLGRLETAKAPEAVGQAVLHEAEATVESIADGKITLEHGPFPTLNMPGMTMAFPLGNPDVAKGLKAGDRVRVFVRSDAKGLTVERLERIGERAGDQP
ncbi:efflux RND transporter periplasmic adaptor subunit [Stenotrophomonas aracearum]|jgi:Cu(I)/Ag(I) efflux system membrane fusion protein|uniref:Efflux RND transporter periplasmic adaptor subunit n=1 Tax=Stenotrophomonas aracearum TaxID=3003272 RepID=A0ABY9YHX2_9GAMM|nr:efflux RND transporter periplasmic adaptor subunit [Stenotrophomonas sp. A5588]WNH50471.1 efflux RND transporter periplasmic adaptor subunit [Stenotrophomonas sp. A5588]